MEIVLCFGLPPTFFKDILLTIVTFGIYQLVASICNLTFDASKPKNIGYKKDAAQA